MKKRKVFFVFLCCLSLLSVLAGCQKKEETKNQDHKKGTAIYYTNKNSTKLIAVKKDIKLKKNSQLAAEALIKEMQKNRKDSKYKVAIPEQVIINNIMVSNNIVLIDFSTGYKKISANEDLICRAGIVYTLTQLKDINYVSFSISGRTMLDTDGKAIGALGKESFVFGELPME